MYAAPTTQLVAGVPTHAPKVPEVQFSERIVIGTIPVTVENRLMVLVPQTVAAEGEAVKSGVTFPIAVVLSFPAVPSPVRAAFPEREYTPAAVMFMVRFTACVAPYTNVPVFTTVEIGV